MHSFDASTLNFGEVVQHISPLNKHYWHFLIGAIHKVRTQHGGGGVSPKCVQLRAGGGGSFTL